MEPHTIYIIFAIGTMVFTAGAAYGGVKYGLNGTNKSLDRIEGKVDKIDGKVDTNKDKIAENRNQIDNQKAICKERTKGINDKLDDK